MAVFREAADCWFSVLSALQFKGGWASWYTYPDFIPLVVGYERESLGGINNDLFRGWAANALMFVHGYRILGNPQLAEAAVQAADLLIELQDPVYKLWNPTYIYEDEGWFALDPDAFNIGVRAQDSAIYVLLFAHDYTEEEQYLDTAIAAADSLLNMQHSTGGMGRWIVPEHERLGFDETHHFNDRLFHADETVAGLMGAFAAVYLRAGHPRHLEGLSSAANFILSTQINRGPGTGCWAEIYDLNLQPAWARDWEPPAISARAVRDNIQLLLWIYSMTGDVKYLGAARDGVACITGLIPTERAVGYWLSLKTGNPIYSENHRVYDLGNPADLTTLREAYGLEAEDDEIRERFLGMVSGHRINWRRSQVLNITAKQMDRLLGYRPNDPTRESIEEHPRPVYPPTLSQVEDEFSVALEGAQRHLARLNGHALFTVTTTNSAYSNIEHAIGLEVFDPKERYGREMEYVLKSLEYFSVLSGEKRLEEVFQWDGFLLHELVFPSDFDYVISSDVWETLPEAYRPPE